ncbi:MAG: 16S rRNA (cytidine(1402)-2'-O)-methyltransferase [Burkholderiaceae bacterium]|jgi:16S rRNA (cytidine1402-2'-O)-methyltransferase
MDINPFVREAEEQQYPPGTLFVVATPIGNLADITVRALAVLTRVDRVAAEDTRMARRLLGHYGISKPCISLHRHNERSSSHTVIAALRLGERIAYISDAGTPAISDPGAKLVASAREAGMHVVPLPGASAAICALSAAGLEEAGFYFLGFLPSKAAQAERVLRELVIGPAHLVLYEAPQRVLETIELLCKVFGAHRRLVIARELTKFFESIKSIRLGEALKWMREDADRQRGEFVLIVEAQENPPDALERARPVLAKLLDRLPLSEAVALAVELTGLPRNGLYGLALDLKRDVHPD